MHVYVYGNFIQLIIPKNLKINLGEIYDRNAKGCRRTSGVSRSAVSRTYTEGASVSLKTREKVKKAALELGYSPNAWHRR